MALTPSCLSFRLDDVVTITKSKNCLVEFLHCKQWNEIKIQLMICEIVAEKVDQLTVIHKKKN